MKRTQAAVEKAAQKKQPQNLTCDKCKAQCCRYIAVVTHTPVERDDYELIRWYLSHKGVAVYIDDGEWYVHIDTTCMYLGRNYRCTVYATRPSICADYEHAGLGRKLWSL